METGVISTTRKVKSQLDADASDAARVRMANGAYSAGSNQGMASNPMAIHLSQREAVATLTRTYQKRS